MQWKIIKDFEDYKVSNTGAVFSIKRNKMFNSEEITQQKWGNETTTANKGLDVFKKLMERSDD